MQLRFVENIRHIIGDYFEPDLLDTYLQEAAKKSDSEGFRILLEHNTYPLLPLNSQKLKILIDDKIAEEIKGVLLAFIYKEIDANSAFTSINKTASGICARICMSKNLLEVYEDKEIAKKNLHGKLINWALNPVVKKIENSLNPLTSKLGKTAKFGATISMLVINSPNINNEKDALQGMNIPSITIDEDGMQLKFAGKDYATHLHAALVDFGMPDVTIVFGKFTDTIKRYKARTEVQMSYTAIICIDNHESVRQLVIDICGYPSEMLQDLYELRKQKQLLEEKHSSYLPKKDPILTSGFHRGRAKWDKKEHLLSINIFINNLNNFSIPKGNYVRLQEDILSSYNKEKEKITSQSLEPSITVVAGDAVEITINLAVAYPKLRIALVNPGGAPGGMVIRGPGTLEEAICRRSDLLPQLLLTHTGLKEAHPLFQLLLTLHETITDSALDSHVARVVRVEEEIKQRSDPRVKYEIPEGKAHYNPDVMFARTSGKKIISYADVVLVDVITVKVPNLNPYHKDSDASKFGGRVSMFRSKDKIQDLEEVIKQNIRSILDHAITNEVGALVCTAIGCGSYRLNPAVVAKCYKEIFNESNYPDYVKNIIIIFPIKGLKTLEAFQDAFPAPTPKVTETLERRDKR